MRPLPTVQIVDPETFKSEWVLLENQTAADNGIPIRNITTSEIKISCLVPQELGMLALEAIHDCFELGRPATESISET